MMIKYHENIFPKIHRNNSSLFVEIFFDIFRNKFKVLINLLPVYFYQQLVTFNLEFFKRFGGKFYIIL